MPFDGTGYVKKPSLFQRFWSRHVMQPKDDIIYVADTYNETQQFLIHAKELISDQRDWCQRRYETAKGQKCAVGALRQAQRNIFDSGKIYDAASIALMSVAVSRGYNSIETMNDYSSHKMVMWAFDEAIKIA